MLLENNYFDIPELYYSSYTGDEITAKTQKEIISNFEKANFGIITCVYALSEGKDLPYLDAVVFAENMTSPIRIVQSALRAIRKNINEPYKRAKIILPILNRDDWFENNENPDLKKVKEVIYQMGLEDETITQKINVFRILTNFVFSTGPHPSRVLFYLQCRSERRTSARIVRTRIPEASCLASLHAGVPRTADERMDEEQTTVERMDHGRA